MRVIYGKNTDVVLEKPTGVGLGNFDGLHIGHMALINTTISESRIIGLNSLVYTFTKHPETILRKGLFTPLLTSPGKKVELLSQTPLNCIFFDEFDENYSRMSAEEFVAKILVDKLGVKLAVAGYNYTFGYKGQGNVDFLKEMGKKYNFRVIEIPPVKIDNEVVSSTVIRRYVSKGGMDRVFKLLGRHYSITGKVVSGRRIGGTLGFPTANIHPEDYLILPEHGVYITRTLLEKKLYSSITNIGRNPTIEDQQKIIVETHILDFDEDIYGRNIEVFFYEKLRGEKKFKDVNELAAQIAVDVARARKY
jgi:riboflavin kinase/FMN adenylyltransferase